MKPLADRLVVELFAGEGGATSAFRDAGYRVIRVELNPRLRPDVVADVRRLPLRRAVRPLLLWASPPCTEFSDANARVDHTSKTPSLELVTATLEAVAWLRPRFWIMENVRGAIPFLGIPAQKIGPWCLWGYFPRIEATPELTHYRKWRFRTARRRAAIPAAFGVALLDTIERHRGVRSLLDMRPTRAHRANARTAGAQAADLFQS